MTVLGDHIKLNIDTEMQLRPVADNLSVSCLCIRTLLRL